MHVLLKIVLLQAALCWPFGSFAQALNSHTTPVIGGPCEGCELVFQGMPAELTSDSRIAPPEEPGEPLVLEGVVRRLDDSPAGGVIVYAYHTNVGGVYPKDATFHGHLRGWARTDSDGRYRFTTIRPAGYPDGAECAHIHMHVIEPGVGTYYIDNVIFDDDPDLSRQLRKKSENGRAGSGLTYPTKRDDVRRIRRDIVPGKNIPGYKHPS
jgi:protocatechuate 3,4-dioxygenase beta subunit